MSNIGIFIRSFKKGGAEKQAILLSKILSKRYKTKLIVLFEEGELIEEARSQINKENIVFIKGSNYLSKAIHFFYYIKKSNLDVLFCYLPSNNVIGTLIGRLAGIKIIFGGLRGAEIKSEKFKMLVQKYVLNNFASAVISNSHTAKKAYSDFGIEEKIIHVIHNGIECNQSFISREEKANVKILSVGRFVAEKDYETSFLAIKRVLEKKNTTDFSYAVVGYGEEENKIKRMVEQYGLNKNVEIIINPKSVDRYYEETDIFLMTSKFEGMPNVIMEAMNYSLPIVTTDAGDVSYLVKDSVNGFVCPVGNVQLISDKLLRLLSSHSLRNEFGKRSYEILKSGFSLDRLQKQYESLIEMYK